MIQTNFDKVKIVDVERNLKFVEGLKMLFELPDLDGVSALHYHGDDSEGNYNSCSLTAEFADGKRVAFGLSTNVDEFGKEFLWWIYTYEGTTFTGHREVNISKEDPLYVVMAEFKDGGSAKKILARASVDLAESNVAFSKEEVKEYFDTLEKFLKEKTA